MRLNRRGKFLVMGLIAGTLFGGTKLMANEMSPEEIYKSSKMSSTVSGKVYVPESSFHFEGIREILVNDKERTEELEANKYDYESECSLFGNDAVFVSEGFIGTVDLGYKTYDYIGLTEHQGKLYLSYKSSSDKELNHIYLEDKKIEIIEDEDLDEDDVYKCIGSLVGAVEKLDR